MKPCKIFDKFFTKNITELVVEQTDLNEPQSNKDIKQIYTMDVNDNRRNNKYNCKGPPVFKEHDKSKSRISV